MTAPTLRSAAVRTRPLEPTDIVRMAQFFYRLSPESVYKRFLTSYSDPEKLLPLMNVDQVHRAAVVAVDAADEIVGVGRYGVLRGDDTTAEVAVIVRDDYQGLGIGSRLLREIAEVATRNRIERLVATVLADNEASLAMLRRLFPDAVLTRTGAQYDLAIPLS